MHVIRTELWIASFTLWTFFNTILQLDAAGDPFNSIFDHSKINIYPFDRINKSVDPCQDFHGFVCGRSGTGRSPIRIPSVIIPKKCNEDYNYLCEAYWHVYNLGSKATDSDYYKFYREKLSELSRLKRKTYMGISNLMLETIPTPLFYFIECKGAYGSSPILSITIHYKMNIDKSLLYYIDEFDNARQIWKDVIDYKLTHITSKMETDVGTEMTIPEFQSISTSVDWIRYLTALLPAGVHRYLAARNQTVEDLPVLTNSRSLLAEYDQIIRKLSSRYIFAKAVVSLGDADEIVKNIRPFIQQAFEALNYRIFYEKFKSKKLMLHESFQPVNEILKNVRQSYISQILNSTWIGFIGQNHAANKLTQMKADFGAPEVLLNNTLFYDHFAALDVIELAKTKDPMKALDLLLRWCKQKLFGMIVPSEEQLAAMNVGAYYLPSLNRMFIGQMYMQDYFFKDYKPAVLNYGSVGVVIAHEMGRALSVYGQNYVDGEFRSDKTMWNKNEFDKRKKCFAKQYRDYKFQNRTLPTDDHRMDENLADYMGVLAAYAAVSRLLEDEMHYVNVKTKFQSSFTEQQLFFITHAYTICDRLRMDFNSPSEPRVNIPLSNMPEFAEAFDCPVGTPMNPTSKCSIWH